MRAQTTSTKFGAQVAPRVNNIYIEYSAFIYIYILLYIYVTGPEKTGLIYIKYTYSCYGAYLLTCASYPNSVSFIKFLRTFYIYGEIRVRILCNYNELLNLKD